jgi:uncharacterized protein
LCYHAPYRLFALKGGTVVVESEIAPCGIFIDRDGQWYYLGAEMQDRETVRLFYDHMSMDSEGRYVLEWAGERCVLEVEDTAYVVRRVRDDGDGKILLHLSDDSVGELDPGTLFVGEGNVLYCRVKGSFPARFTRPAYYQIAEQIEEKGGGYFLDVAGKSHEIRFRTPSPPFRAGGGS